MPVRIWSETLVNVVTAGLQEQPHVATLINGGFVVVWRTSSNSGDIRARLFGFDGLPTSGELVIERSSGSAFSEGNPVVAVLDNGNFTVAWDNDTSVAFRTYDSTGAIVTGSSTTGSAARANISRLGAGTITVFESAAGDIVATSSVFTGVVNTTTAGEQDDPDVAELSDGRFVIVWQTDSTDIRGRIFSAAGAPAGGDFVINTIPLQSGNGTPHVTALKNGAFLVVWQTGGSPFPGQFTDIRGRIYDGAGIPVANDFLVNSSTDDAEQFADAVALPDGGFLVVWLRLAGGVIQGQRFDSLGERSGDVFVVNTIQANTFARTPVAAALPDGRVVVTWVGGDGLSSIGVYATILDPREGNISGTQAADTIFGGHFDDQVVAFSGADTIFALGGADVVYAGAGADTVFASLGDDAVYGGADNDLLNTGTGADVAYGEAGDDLFFGELGDDLFFGHDGNDTLNGGGGADSLYGQNGDDVGFGEDGDDAFFLGFGNDTAFTGAGNDVAFGEEGGDNLQGEDGDDFLDGGTGGDVLDGGPGVDNLIGGVDGDILIGGLGGDRIDPGAGADTIWWKAPAEGNDLMVGFVSADDQLQFTGSAFGFAPAATLTLGQNFVLGTVPTQATPTFYYTGGSLFFDSDGTGIAAPIFIALLQGAPTLTAGDFQFV